jgi:NADH dehydrogenase (ubiquinone) 1 alpha subcomplex subunit 5
MFRATRTLLAAATKPAVKAAPVPRTKVVTGIAGLDVHPRPLPALAQAYTSTLKVLEKIPAAAVYRQSAEAITKERLAIVQRREAGDDQATEADIEAVEREIDAGLVEELLLQAQDELKLASKMLEYKPSVWPSPSSSFPSTTDLTSFLPRAPGGRNSPRHLQQDSGPPSASPRQPPRPTICTRTRQRPEGGQAEATN